MNASCCDLSRRIACLRRAGHFLLAGYNTVIPKGGRRANRRCIAAKAFGTCGLVLQDDRLVAASRKLIAHANQGNWGGGGDG